MGEERIRRYFKCEFEKKTNIKYTNIFTTKNYLFQKWNS